MQCTKLSQWAVWKSMTHLLRKTTISCDYNRADELNLNINDTYVS